MEVMPTLGKFDALITDPPYGVSGGSGTLGLASLKTKYQSGFDDTRENIMNYVVPLIITALSISKRGVLTPGTPCAFLYPEPDDMGVIYQPATTGMNKWGRETTQPVLFYGKDPRAGLTIQPKHFQNTFQSDKNGHPCPKPIEVMNWMVSRGSLDGESILDPFMGSGTTGVAAIRLGRKFTGIEREPKYFDIACRQIEQAVAQGQLFAPEPMKQVQESFL
jgi:site-specific DNA-methyltransferase (adenine-specific)/modification methylase